MLRDTEKQRKHLCDKELARGLKADGKERAKEEEEGTVAAAFNMEQVLLSPYREIKQSKKIYYNNYFNKYSSDMKKMWKGIRSIVNIKQSTAPQITQLNINGKLVNNPVGIAEKVNDFFVNIGPETENCIPKVVNSSPGTFLKNRNQFNFVIAHISEEVVDIINSLSNKSTGIHSIPLNLLIIIMDIIIIPLCFIINMSLSTGTYPDKLKIVKVILIHNGGCTQDLNNFRPISLLSIFDTLIEKIIHSKLYMFFEANNILFNQQFGFRKNNSRSPKWAQTPKIYNIFHNFPGNGDFSLKFF